SAWLWLTCCGMQLVVIAHINAKPELGCDLGVTGRQLFFVMVEVEIEPVLRVHVDQVHVRIVHGEFAELQLAASIGHVVARRLCGQALRLAEYLDDVVTRNLYSRELPRDMWKGQDFLRIQDEVIALRLDATNFAGADQLCDIES